MDDQHDPGPDRTDEAGSGAAADPLLEVRTALDHVDELPLAERTEVFERTHEVVTDELRSLELG